MNRRTLLQNGTNVLTAGENRGTLEADLPALRQELETLERRLINSLMIVQRMLGKEPTVQTRAERRGRR